MAVSISLSISQNSQSVANNTSNVTVTVSCSWTYGSWNGYSPSGTLYIDGKGYGFSSSFNTGRTTTGSQTLFSKTVNVSHNSDGTKTLYCSASFATGVSSGTVTCSGSRTLSTIARKSTLSVANGTLGTAQTLKITEQSSAFYHKLTYSCGDTSGYILGSSSSTSSTLSTSWTPPISLASENTTGTSVSIKFVLYTYTSSSGTLIGNNSYTKTFSIPSSVKPSCSLTVTDPTGYKSTYGGYVKGRSKFKVVITPTTSYGSAIKTYSGSANGETITAATTTTGVLKSSGSLTITGSVTDARGRTGSASTTATVLDYSAASITALSVKRCDSDGTENMQGEYVQVTFSSSVTSLSSKNKATYTLKYKQKSATSYTTVTLSAYANNYAVSNGTYIFAADTSSSYDVTLTVADAFDSDTKTTVASTAFALMHWRNEGDGIAFGKVAERGEMEIGMNMFMNNQKGFYCAGTDGLWYNMMGSNSLDNFHFGYGGYNNSFGSTYYNGNKIYIRSKGDIYMDPGGLDVIVDGNIVIPNGKALYGTFTDGTTGSVIYVNGSNNTIVGYGGYTNEKGYTNIYGYNGVNLNTEGNIKINGTELFKIYSASAGKAAVYGSDVTICSLTLPSGRYIISGTVTCSIGANACLRATIGHTTGTYTTWTGGIARTTMDNGGGAVATVIAVLTTESTVSLASYGYYNATYNFNGYFGAIRLGDA